MDSNNASASSGTCRAVLFAEDLLFYISQQYGIPWPEEMGQHQENNSSPFSASIKMMVQQILKREDSAMRYYLLSLVTDTNYLIDKFRTCAYNLFTDFFINNRPQEELLEICVIITTLAVHYHLMGFKSAFVYAVHIISMFLSQYLYLRTPFLWFDLEYASTSFMMFEPNIETELNLNLSGIATREETHEEASGSNELNLNISRITLHEDKHEPESQPEEQNLNIESLLLYGPDLRRDDRSLNTASATFQEKTDDPGSISNERNLNPTESCANEDEHDQNIQNMIRQEVFNFFKKDIF